MLSHVVHESIRDCVEYMAYLDERRKEAHKDFLEYTRRLDKEREHLEKIKAADSNAALS